MSQMMDLSRLRMSIRDVVEGVLGGDLEKDGQQTMRCLYAETN